MRFNVLILGGTTEARELARRMADAGMIGTISLAGRVESPRPQPLPHRVGGFGGAEGLAHHIADGGYSHVVDATHPFAARISANAVAACAETDVPLIRLTRPPWQPVDGDRWTHVPDISAASTALEGPARRVMLAVGRQHLSDFAGNPQHFYLLRLVDPPVDPLPLPNAQVIVDRGPYRAEGDRALMRTHGIDIVVSKNSGGGGAYAKIEAARSLNLPVLMIERPTLPPVTEVHEVDAVLRWYHAGTERGV
ncbi:cobalt-precorrin-6A reductase [Paracoccus sp. PAR01]|uniref:cobalt-precorrin-6A reductase n=1 Tax=Paracoccus sp. PAR01 TaxID=2769282 RepID=UPI001781518E|nr:cobalt-precorrin-6A reductase [Paracoccus sp. PAR01]MBD9529363.1 cobalt-precorrin-6A reductase [Paracoccus sp. PAR01]